MKAFPRSRRLFSPWFIGPQVHQHECIKWFLDRQPEGSSTSLLPPTLQSRMGKKSRQQHSTRTEGEKPRKRGKKTRSTTSQSATQGSEHTQPGTPQRPKIEEAQKDMQQQPLQAGLPAASSTDTMLAAPQHPPQPLEATAHTAVLCQAVNEAVLRLMADNWNITLAAATQALHRLNMSMALQILEAVTTTAPVDVNTWLGEQAMAASSTPQHGAEPQVPIAPIEAHTKQEAHNTRAKPSLSVKISKQIVAFGRYAGTRPVGMTTDALGRLSLNNLMAVWGNAQGLTPDQVKSVLRQHSSSRKGQRFTTTAMHNDLFIEVSNATKHRASDTKHSSHTRTKGAPRSPKRCKYR